MSSVANKKKRASGRAPKRSGPRLTVREAAEQLGVTTSCIYQTIKRGDLPMTRVNNLITIKRADLRAYVRKISVTRAPRDPNRPLTDEEFLQALWDSDPD